MEVVPTYEFLLSIDPDLCQYTDILKTKGFNNTRVLKHLTYDDLHQLPVGHRRLLLNEVSKIRSPHSKALLTSLDAQALQINTLSRTVSESSPIPRVHNPVFPDLQPKTLQPKTLFPSTPSQNSETDLRIKSYSYCSPMEKHLNRILKDVDAKQKEIDDVKAKHDQMSALLVDEEFDSRPNCSNCHQVGHKRNKCVTEKCLTSKSCGKVKLHKEELKEHDNLKVRIKKLNKDKSTLESEALKLQDTILATNRTFHERVRTTLINSNKGKYLTMYGNEIVPLTKVINLDLSILQRHYKNKVPDDLEAESEQFSYIISGHLDKFKTMETSINSKLLESVRRIDSRIRKTPTDNTLVSLDSPSCLAASHTSVDDETVVDLTSVTNKFNSLLTPMKRLRSTPVLNLSAKTKVSKLCEPTSDRANCVTSGPVTTLSFITPGGGYSPFPSNINGVQSGSHSSACSPSVLPTDTNIFGQHATNNLWYSYPQQVMSQQPVGTDISVKRENENSDGTLSDSKDYSILYDQFNLKPKWQFIQRYTEGTPTGSKVMTPLNEPDLD